MIMLLAYTQTHHSPLTTALTSAQLTTGNSQIYCPGQHSPMLQLTTSILH